MQKKITTVDVTNVENVELKDNLSSSDENVHQDYDSDGIETNDVDEDLSGAQSSSETNATDSNLKKILENKPYMQEQTNSNICFDWFSFKNTATRRSEAASRPPVCKPI